jgi:hypothetical protein
MHEKLENAKAKRKHGCTELKAKQNSVNISVDKNRQ